MSQQKIGLMILRLGLVSVYAYFGISQLMAPEKWLRLVPEWMSAISGLSANTIVLGNGIFEIIFALLLLVGYKVRIVSWILAAHLAVITAIVGFSPTGARDFGLTLATLAHGFLEGDKNQRV